MDRIDSPNGDGGDAVTAPPPREASTPVMTSVREVNTSTEKVLPHSDPTFYEVAKRLDSGHGSWTLQGPSFEDGTRPMFQIEWRLGELLMKFLMRYANAKLSRTQREDLKKGLPVTRIRLVKKTTPAAGSNANQASNEGSTKTPNK